MEKANGTRLILRYDGKELTIHGEGVPAQLAIWMLETAKVSLITRAGKRQPAFNLKGLNLEPLNPKRLR